MYFKVRPDCQLAWSLMEQSADDTGKPAPFADANYTLNAWSGGYLALHQPSVQTTGLKIVFPPTVLRPLDPSEEPSEVVDFWGKTRVSKGYCSGLDC